MPSEPTSSPATSPPLGPKPPSAIPGYLTNGTNGSSSIETRDKSERDKLRSSITSSTSGKRQAVDLDGPSNYFADGHIPNKRKTKRQRPNDVPEEHARDPRDEAGPPTPMTVSRPASPFTHNPTIDFDGLSWPSLGTKDRREESPEQAKARMEKLTGAIRTVLECIGEEPEREGLFKTPERYAEAMMFFTKGYEQNLRDIVNGAVFHEDHDELVIVKDIEVFSLCEHHLVPFTGKIHIGYIPNRRVLGLSKLARIADMFARRLQVQERLTKQVALALSEVLQPRGVAVVMESSHLCMVMRGVQKTSSSTTTSCMLGCMRSNAKTREEFLNLLNRR